MTLDDDSGDSAPTALRVQPAARSRLVVARSLADAGPGETVIVNRRGQTVRLGQFNAMKALSWATMVGGGAFVAIVYSVLVSPTVGVIAGVAVQLLALLKLRHWPALRTAIAHAAACRWEEARSALLALERKRLPPSQRHSVQGLLAAIEALLGQPQQAFDRLERARASLSRRGSSHILRCQAAALRAGTLGTLGRFAEARNARDELVREAAAATGRAGRPRGDYLEMLVQSTELSVAAAADTPDALPDDDTLHVWARAALGRSRFGEMLVSLAWAFHRRGDDDMARHLLAEAPSRVTRWSLAQTIPRLDAWAKEHARAWEIEGFG